MSGTTSLFALLICAAPAVAAEPPGDAQALFEKAVERHYAMRQYRVEVRTSTVSGDRLQPSDRVRITVDEEAQAFHYEGLAGARHQALSDGARLWVRGSRGVTEAPAEGPELRMWRQAIDRNSGRFALLGRSALDAEWVKRETVKRGKARIECGVIRIRPADPLSGNWSEMIWISPETGLIWRSVFIERASPPGPSMAVPPTAQGGGARHQPMMSWDTVRTREYDWLHTEGDLPADAFAKPAWAEKAKQR
jgi:hypothetical protein